MLLYKASVQIIAFSASYLLPVVEFEKTTHRRHGSLVVSYVRLQRIDHCSQGARHLRGKKID